MLTRLKLANFKSWQNLDLELAPITLLFGTNSSGKSSILQALLLLKQTAEGFDRKQHINFGGGKRDLVDLGSYRDLIHQHNTDHRLGINVIWDWPQGIHIESEFYESKVEINSLSYSATWGQVENDVRLLRLLYDGYDDIDIHVNQSKVFIHTELREQEYQYHVSEPYEWQSVNLPKSGSVNAERDFSTSPESGYRLPIGALDLKIYDTTMDGEQHWIGNEYIKTDSFNRAFETVMQKMFYLKPLRLYPERTYTWTGSNPQTIEPDGENTIAALIAAERRNDDLLSNVSRWLAEMGIVDEFNIAALDKDKRFYETKVKIGDSISSLLDVGFGVSQVLPIITLLFFAPEGSIILLEQPELHLHPRAQAVLADLFLEVAEKRSLQLIVESHSEHLLTRMQRRIAEVESPFASPENVKAYFCESTPDGSQIRDVEIDKYGQIQNWPHKFFGDLSGDLDALTDAALSRRREELISGD